MTTKTKAKTSSFKKDNEVTLKVANTEIKIGSTYEVIGKLDRSAPDGFQKNNTTKYLHEGNAEVRGIPYIEQNRKWDTGFDPFSLCNMDLLQDVRDEHVDLFNTYIKEPFEKEFQVDCSSVNNDFWRTYTYELYTNKSFNTENPKDLFDLFHALKQGRICEVGEKDPTLQKANYCVRNLEKAKSVEDQRVEDKYDAVAKFSVLVEALDPEKDDTLYTVLEWLQMPNVRNSDKDTLKKLVFKMFDQPNGYDFARRFLDGLKLAKSEEGQKQMEYFSILQKLSYKNKLEFKRGTYYFEGIEVGANLKGGALKATKDPEFAVILQKAYEKYLA